MGLRNVSSFDDVLVEKLRRAVHTALGRLNEHDELEHVAELWPRQERDAWRERQRVLERHDLDAERQRERAQEAAAGSSTEPAPSSETPIDRLIASTASAAQRSYAQAAGHLSDNTYVNPYADNAESASQRERSGSDSSTWTDDTLRGDRGAQRRSDEAYRQRYSYTYQHFVEHLDPEDRLVRDLIEILVGETARSAIAETVVPQRMDPIGATDFAAHVMDANRLAADRERTSSFRSREGARQRALRSEIQAVARRTRRGPRLSTRDSNAMQREIHTSSTANPADIHAPPHRTISTRTLYSSYAPSSQRLGQTNDPPWNSSTSADTTAQDSAATLRSARVGLRSSNSALRRTDGSAMPSSSPATALVRSEVLALRRRIERTEHELQFHTTRTPSSAQIREAMRLNEAEVNRVLAETPALSTDAVPRDDSAQTAEASSLVRRFLQQPFPSDARSQGGAGAASTATSTDRDSPRATEFARHAASQRQRARWQLPEENSAASTSEAAASDNTGRTRRLPHGQREQADNSEATLSRAQEIMQRAEQVNRDARQTLENAYTAMRDITAEVSEAAGTPGGHFGHAMARFESLRRETDSALRSSTAAAALALARPRSAQPAEDSTVLRHVVGDGDVGQALRGNDLPLAPLPARARDTATLATEAPPGAPASRLSQSPQRQGVAARR